MVKLLGATTTTRPNFYYIVYDMIFPYLVSYEIELFSRKCYRKQSISHAKVNKENNCISRETK